jgi:hypothetical protein
MLILLSVASSQGFTGLKNLTESHNEISGLAAIDISGPNNPTKNNNQSVTGTMIKLISNQLDQKPSSEDFNQESASNFITWNDPEENAFTLEVPTRWNIKGGLFRYSLQDVRPTVEAISPDGKIRITIGDPNIPTYIVPVPPMDTGTFLVPLGAMEGQLFTDVAGTQFFGKAYQTGEQFVEEYVKDMTENEGFTDIKILNKQDLGSISIPGFSLNSANITFECSKNETLMFGYYYATTRLNTVPDGTGSIQWMVPQLFGYIAPVSRKIFAESIMNHMVGTYQQNPGFVDLQIATAACISDIQESVNRDTSNMILQSYINRQNSEEEISRIRKNKELGLVDVVDKDTGETWKTDGLYNYYWKCGDMITNTETSESPDKNCRPVYEY